MDIAPNPTDEEAAAIAAALTVALAGGAAAPETEPPRWRFSGRWWAQPIPLRRRRPW